MRPVILGLYFVLTEALIGICRIWRNQRSSPVFVRRSIRLLHAGDVRAAELNGRVAVAFDPTSEEAYATLGHAYEEAGKLGRARATYTEGVARVGPTPQLRLLLAGIDLTEGHLNAAEAATREIVSTAPDSWDAHRALGSLLVALGRIDEARDVYATFLRAHPGDHRAVARLAALPHEEGGTGYLDSFRRPHC